MKSGVLIALMVLCCTVSAFAQTDSAFRVKDFRGAKVTYTKASVPKVVVDKMNQISSFNDIADSGEDFNATDVVRPGLKWNKIMYFVTLKKYYLLVYEQGGFASHDYYILFYRKGKEIGGVRTLQFNIRKWPLMFPDVKDALLKHDFKSNKLK